MQNFFAGSKTFPLCGRLRPDRSPSLFRRGGIGSVLGTEVVLPEAEEEPGVDLEALLYARSGGISVEIIVGSRA